MIKSQDRNVTVKRQCELVGLARSTSYYRPRGESAKNLSLMRRMDEIYTDHPFYGVRQMTRVLRREGDRVNPKRIRRLMRLMGLEAQCPKPNLSKPAPGHKVYPYLMKSMKLDGPNQAWCADITYIRLEGGFVYLVAIMDWFSRKVLAWELSNTFDTAFCLKCLLRAVETHGIPSVMNTDQGSQFTSDAWTGQLERLGVAISMDERWTTPSSNGSGEVSNMRKSTYESMAICRTPGDISVSTSSSTITAGPTAHLVTKHRPRPTGNHSARRPHERNHSHRVLAPSSDEL